MVLQGMRTLPGMDYRMPHAAFPGQLYGLGDVITPDATDTSWMNNIPNWITQIQTAINTQKLLDINTQRAQQGLPPITAAQVAPTVNFGLSAQTQQLVLYGAGALLLMMLLKKV